jgi:hypothetical protein
MIIIILCIGLARKAPPPLNLYSINYKLDFKPFMVSSII